MEFGSKDIDKGALYRDVLENRFLASVENGESKILPLAEAVRRYVKKGMSLHFLGLHYRAHAAIFELLRQFKDSEPDFTIIAGTLHGPIMALFHAGMIKKALTAFSGEAYPTMGPNPVYNRLYKENKVSFENWSFLTLT